MVPIIATTIHPIASIQNGYLYCLRIGNFLPAINIIESAKGKINPLTNPAINNNSLGLPRKINIEVDIMMNAVIDFRSF